MIRKDVDELIEFLDSLAKLDPVAMGTLVSTRAICNKELADHPTVQTGQAPGCGLGICEVGMLGILNGYGGTFEDGKRKGWGAITAVMEIDGRVTAFKRTAND